MKSLTLVQIIFTIRKLRLSIAKSVGVAMSLWKDNKNEHKTNGMNFRVTLLLVFALLLFCLDLFLPLGIAHGVIYVGLILCTVWIPARKYIWISAILASILTILGYFLSPSIVDPWKAIVNRHLSLYAIWIAATLVWLNKRDKQVQDAEKKKLLSLTEDLSKEITERKQAEERFFQIIESAPDATIITNDDGTIQLVSAQAVKMFGYRKEELLGKKIEELISEEFQKRNVGHRESYVASSQVPAMRSIEMMELTGRRKNGEEFSIEISLAPVHTKEGILISGAIRDITDRKKAEQQLRKFTEELKQANVELERFAYVASHDLQEPLRIIMSFSEMLPKDLGSELPEAAQKDLSFITDAAKRMQRLIRDLLTLSRVRKERLNLSRIPLTTCVEDALGLLSARIQETGAKIHNGSFPTVHGDRTMLTQLYQNLIGNALKFTNSNVPEVHITSTKTDGQWIFGVQDNGIGIEKEYQDQIFSAFKRLHRASDYEGTGIGLAICKRAVELHGGRIWAESGGKGKGSHFRFTLNNILEEET